MHHVKWWWKTEKAINCIVVGIPWSVGYSVTALIAQITRDWFQMLVVIACITAPWPIGWFSFQSYQFKKLNQFIETQNENLCQFTFYVCQSLSDFWLQKDESMMRKDVSNVFLWKITSELKHWTTHMLRTTTKLYFMTRRKKQNFC